MLYNLILNCQHKGENKYTGWVLNDTLMYLFEDLLKIPRYQGFKLVWNCTLHIDNSVKTIT